MTKNKYRNDFEMFFHERMGYKILADRDQYDFVEAILAPTKEVQAVFTDSKAGTGKSSIALTAAYYMLERGEIDTIGYIRNTVAVRATGFLPGTVEDKEAAYMKPAEDIISRIGYKNRDQNLFENMINNEELFCTSTSFLRGVDYDKRMVLIIDEAQNLDLTELQTVLTRAHDSVKVVVIGSSLQNDNHKMERYGKNKSMIPFQVYIEHFMRQSQIPVKVITLNTNYRGRFANYADEIGRTVASIQEEARKLPAKQDDTLFALTDDEPAGFTAKGLKLIRKQKEAPISIAETIGDPDGDTVQGGLPGVPFYGLDSFH